MSYRSVGAALDAQLQTLPGFDAANVAWEGVVYTPSPGTPYLAVQIAALAVRSIAAGTKGANQWDGIYQVISYRPLGEGNGPIQTQVDAIRALFPKGLSLITTDGLSLIFMPPQPAPLVQEHEWIKGVARMPFFFFEMPT